MVVDAIPVSLPSVLLALVVATLLYLVVFMPWPHEEVSERESLRAGLRGGDSCSLTVSVDHRLASDKAGVGGDQARSSSSVSRGLTTGVGCFFDNCSCNTRLNGAHINCPVHGFHAWVSDLARKPYDQETDQHWHLNSLIDQVRA